MANSLQPLYQPWTDLESVLEPETNAQGWRSLVYQKAQRLQEKLQYQINQLLSYVTNL